MTEQKKPTKLSFNHTVNNVLGPQVTHGVYKPWKLQGEQLEEFFKCEDKSNPQASLNRIAQATMNFGEDQPEKLLARMIVTGVTNWPSKQGEGISRQKVYVNDQQKQHDELKKQAQANIDQFISTDPTCVALQNLKVNVNGKMIGIVPKVHMRDAAKVIDSYDGGQAAATAPAPAPQTTTETIVTQTPLTPTPAPVQGQAQAPTIAPVPIQPQTIEATPQVTVNPAQGDLGQGITQPPQPQQVAQNQPIATPAPASGQVQQVQGGTIIPPPIPPIQQ